MHRCINEDEALEFGSDTLSEEKRRAIEAHINVCSACLELTLALSDESRSGSEFSSALAPTASGLATSEKVANYTILEEVGSGGMGVVYAAYDLELERRLALKIVRRSGPVALQRIRREAQALARMSHPNVVTVYGVHSLPDDELVIAMEYVQGESLRKWVEAQSQRPWTELRQVFLQAAAGLASAHRAGLVHRDFKPDNVLVTPEGNVKVIDFGLVGVSTERTHPLPVESTTSVPLTREGAFVGTPEYMAPEQLDHGVVDARTDQFAFCVTLFEAVYGRRPFSATTPGERRKKLLEESLEMPERPRDVPRAAEALLRRGLSPDPGQRFLSMNDLASALRSATERPPWYRSRSLSAVLVATLVFAILLLPREPPCSPPAEAFTDSWGPSVKSDIRSAFRSTGLGYAEDAWDRTQPRLDAFVASWHEMHAASCKATVVHRAQTPHVHALRKNCLFDKRERFRSIVTRLRSATSNVVDRAPDLVFGLSLAECENEAALLAVRPPQSSTVAESVAEIKDALISLGVRYEIAAYEESLADSELAVRDAKESGYQPLVGEALLWRGRFLYRSHQYEAAAAVLTESYGIAVEVNDIDLATDASRELTWVVGYFLAKPELGFQWNLNTRGFARRREVGGLQEARSLGRLGKLEAFTGKSEDARAHLQMAEKMFRRKLEQAHPELGEVIMDLGTSYFGEGRYREALFHYQRALEIRKSIYGARHFRTVSAYQNVGIALINLESWIEAEKYLNTALGVLMSSGRGRTYEEGLLLHNMGSLARKAGQPLLAKERFQRSFEVLREVLGVEHHRTALPLRGLGELAFAEGDIAAAIGYFEEALRIAQAKGQDPGYLGNAEFSLARALHAANKRSRARLLAGRAHARYRERGLSEDAERVQSWLVTHGYR